LKEFLIKIPAVCGAPNAEAWGKMNELAFDHEKANPDSVFAKRDGVSLEDRLFPAFGFLAHEDTNQDKADFAFNLLVLTSLAHDLSKGSGDEDEVQGPYEELSLDAHLYPDVEALYTVQEARAGQWA